MMHLTIKIFPYDPHWGGGFGWLVLPAPGGDRICSLASSERPSATPELAITAAEHWIAQHALGDASTSLDLPQHPHPLRDAGVSGIFECEYMTNTLDVSNAAPSDPVCSPRAAAPLDIEPWVAAQPEGSNGFWYIDEARDLSPCGHIATVWSSGSSATAGEIAARLIAAAPELLAALKACKQGAEYCDELGEIIDAAIAKAGSP